MKSKIIISILILTLLFTSTLGFSSLTATSQVTRIDWVTTWSDPREIIYWYNVIDEYERLHPDVDIHITFWSMDELRLMIYGPLYPEFEDPDMYHLWYQCIPLMVEAERLSMPPADVQVDVAANWTVAALVTYLYTLWGYPTELVSEALVYNKRILNETGITPPEGRPWTWDELATIATAVTAPNETGVINRTGLCFLDAPSE